eukprot:1451611-Alexandrium_andersonii.AAC.1
MRREAVDLHSARSANGAEGKGRKAPPGSLRPALHKQPATPMSFRKEASCMTGSQQKPLESRRLPWPTGVPREVINESRNPNGECAPRRVQDRVVRKRPEEGARSAPMPTLRRSCRTGPAHDPETAWTRLPATVAMRARRSHTGMPSPSMTSWSHLRAMRSKALL